jgi:hypothetical protein|tara:strand:+ start:142 stop:501 length:360 start_codon:yes stop_codon:yes gene_type:complete
MNGNTVLEPHIEKILAKLMPGERAAVRKMLVDEKKKSAMEDQMEFFQSAQDQSAATAPGGVGQPVPIQQLAMVNQANLAGMGGSLLQMSPPFDPSVRQQLQQGNRKREDELFGTRMFFT